MRQRQRVHQYDKYLAGDKPGSGPGGNCICPQCKHTVPHVAAVPCNEMKCPKCGALMTKE